MKIAKSNQNKPLLFLMLITCQIISGNVLSAELNQNIYSEQKDNNGTVLVAVNWGRQWSCGQFENAQLEKLKFELINPSKDLGESASQINLISPSRLFVDSKFIDYGFVVEPGDYAITEFSVKVAKSSSDVGYHEGSKDELIKNGTPEGGTFSVKSGEIVYIGHFFLDCYEYPIPWRFYPEGRNEFEGYKKHIKKQFPYIDESTIKFRLFKTKLFGHDFEL